LGLSCGVLSTHEGLLNDLGDQRFFLVFQVSGVFAEMMSSATRDVDPRRARGMGWKNKERNFVAGVGITS